MSPIQKADRKNVKAYLSLHLLSLLLLRSFQLETLCLYVLIHMCSWGITSDHFDRLDLVGPECACVDWKTLLYLWCLSTNGLIWWCWVQWRQSPIRGAAAHHLSCLTQNLTSVPWATACSCYWPMDSCWYRHFRATWILHVAIEESCQDRFWAKITFLIAYLYLPLLAPMRLACQLTTIHVALH